MTVGMEHEGLEKDSGDALDLDQGKGQIQVVVVAPPDCPSCMLT